MEKIMVIEDDGAIRDELALILENEGYGTVLVTDFEDVTGQVINCAPALVLLDLGLPGRDGMMLCADIRKKTQTPVIIVTSRDSAVDELKALSLGGDDYITKPYNVPVLLARVRTVLRRCGGLRDADILEANGLILHLTKGIAEKGGQKAELTRNELKILARLMSDKGEIVSRADLLESLWDNQIYIDDNTLSVNITRLRAKLEEIGLPDFIKTRRGMGYQI